MPLFRASAGPRRRGGGFPSGCTGGADAVRSPARLRPAADGGETRRVAAGRSGLAVRAELGRFRCLAFRVGADIELRAKSGKPLGRYFSEVLALLRKPVQTAFVIAAALLFPLGDTRPHAHTSDLPSQN